jgi:hypothetical protein
MRIFSFVLIALFHCSSYAATPLMHLYLAEEYNRIVEKGQIEDLHPYYRGAIFPDIRYLAKVPRTKTHVKFPSLKEIQNEKDPFQKGILLHTYIDEERNQYIASSSIYKLVKKYVPSGDGYFLKLAEDELISRRVHCLSYLLPFLENPSQGELNTGINEETISHWNKGIAAYICLKPSQIQSLASMMNQNISWMTPEILKDWSKKIPELTKEKEFEIYFEGLLQHFQTRFEEANTQ